MDGIIESPPFGYWIDHADLDRSNANFAFNALYLLTMKDYRDILRWMGDDKEAQKFEDKIASLRVNMHNRFWDPEEKLFCEAVDGERRSTKFSEHANSLAIVTGIATPEQEAEIVNEIIDNNSARLVPAVLFMHFIAEALFVSGHGKEAVSLLKSRYGSMKKDGSPTLWEEWSMSVTHRSGRFEPINRRAYAQGENAFPAYSLMRWVLGVQPVKPGLSEVVLSCNLCGLSEVEGAVPTPRGTIQMAWKKGKKAISLEVQVPEGLELKVDLTSEDLRGKKMVAMDGQNFVINELSSGTIEVPAGRHNLKFY